MPSARRYSFALYRLIRLRKRVSRYVGEGRTMVWRNCA
jgi:hypothetical protein